MKKILFIIFSLLLFLVPNIAYADSWSTSISNPANPTSPMNISNPLNPISPTNPINYNDSNNKQYQNTSLKDYNSSCKIIDYIIYGSVIILIGTLIFMIIILFKS